MPSEQLKFNIMTQSIKDELALTEQEQRVISQFLSAQLRTLATEKRVGNRHYNNDQIVKDIERAIRSMAETIWE
tara:strand:+ start:1189 stop:1410 length:222 start_codon:yes stop_codon:yes gene_type:complete